MFPLKRWMLLTTLFMIGYSERTCQAQQLQDAYAIAETQADLPAAWKAAPENLSSRSGNSNNRSFHRWLGHLENPAEPPSPQNTFLSASWVRILVCKSQQEARATLTLWTQGNSSPPISGAYTSKTLGDICFRGTGRLTSASLWFCRDNVACDIHINGPESDIDYPAAVEKIAHAILGRMEAGIALSTDAKGTVLTNAPNPGIRHPNGVAVVLLAEWIGGVEATWKPDWDAGTATVKKGKHTLSLKIGSKEAQLDGKPITLAFPALRHGKEGLWCPTDVLQKLTE